MLVKEIVMKKKCSIYFAGLFTLFLLLNYSAIGQTATATLKGTVSDESGKVIPGALVTLTQTSTRTKRTFTSTGEGSYTFTFIEPGDYEIDVKVEGFKTFRQTDIRIEVAQSGELDVSLAAGDISEEVTVTSGESNQIETTSGALGGVVGRERVDALPLNGRNVYQLSVLEPGVNNTPASRGLNPIAQGLGALSINGGRGLTNEILLDGAVTTNKADNLPALRPSVDSIQEFRILTNAYSAEYGRTGGGALNFSTRSGGSEFHGTLWEFFRNDALDAASYFTNATRSQKEKLRFNQFGGNIGGPILVPFGEFGDDDRIFKNTGKLFFFVNYENLRIKQTQFRQSTVPTVRQRNGDFGELLGAPIAGVMVRDTTGAVIQARIGQIYVPGAVVPAGMPGAGSRIAFANNIISTGQINNVARNVLAFYPLPNRPGTTNATGLGFSNNFVSNQLFNVNYKQVVARIDYKISSTQQLFGRLSYENNLNFDSGPFPDSIASTTGVGEALQLPKGFVADYVNSFTPTTIFHASVGFSRFNNTVVQPSDGFDVTSLGLPSSIASASPDSGVFPTFTIAGYSQLGPPRFLGNASNTQDIYSFNQDLTTILGSHTIKFGANQRIYTINNRRPDDPAGNFASTAAFTQRAPGLAGAGTGDGFASFLLGNPTSGHVGVFPVPEVKSNYLAFFVQDDWTVNSRLTLNLGLRWESDLPTTEVNDRLTNFDLDAPFPVSSLTVAFPAATGLGTRNISVRGAITPVGRGNVETREQADKDLNNFGPRVGVAFKLTDKTVIRAGGGIFYSSATGGGFSPSGYGVTDSADTGFVSGAIPTINLSNPFPSGIAQPNPATLLNGFTGYGLAVVNARTRDRKQPYVAQWNLNVQRELPWKLLASVSYAGSSGVGLLSGNTSINQIAPEFAALGNTILTTPVANPFLTLPVDQRPPAGSILSGATVTVAQLLRPFPQFGDVQDFFPNEGHSTYHSGQFSLSRRLSNGLSFTTAYTFAKLIDDISAVQLTIGVAAPNYENFYDRNSNRALSTFDVKHRFVGNMVYVLPFGKGQKFLKDGVASKIFGGFTVNAITQFQSGFPLAISTVANFALNGLAFVTVQRPNVLRDPFVGGSPQTRLTRYFDTTAFSNPAPFTFGNVPRTLSSVRGPDYFSTNLSLHRNFSLTEEVRLQFRAEAFNVFNRANFSNPGTLSGGAGFGQITNTEDPRQLQFALKLYF